MSMNQRTHLQIARAIWMVGAAFGLAFLTGCTSPLSEPSPLVLRAAPMAAPPAGKSLIQIHRPRARQGYGLYSAVYSSTAMIADLGNGHSVAYVCDPGTHYIINRSIERVGVVEAKVLADQTYHLRLDTAGTWMASFQIEPIKKKDSRWKQIPKWTKDHIWVSRGPAAAEHEAARRNELDLILKDFVNGEKKDRLRRLDPDDHQ